MAAKTVSKELLEIICCPADNGNLKIDKTKQTLTCETCKTIYQIKESIPILLPK